MPRAICLTVLKQVLVVLWTIQEAALTIPAAANTNDSGSYSYLATSTTISPKTPASFVSSSLATRVSLLSLSDKSTVHVMGNVDVDYAAGSFCPSCVIPPPKTGGLWCD